MVQGQRSEDEALPLSFTDPAWSEPLHGWKNTFEEDESDTSLLKAEISKNFVQVEVHGWLNHCDFARLNAKKNVENARISLRNKELGIYLSEGATQIKSPLKENSTLKQVMNANSGSESVLKLDFLYSASLENRQVRVNESKSIGKGSLLISANFMKEPL